jgi:hypothetical protein
MYLFAAYTWSADQFHQEHNMPLPLSDTEKILVYNTQDTAIVALYNTNGFLIVNHSDLSWSYLEVSVVSRLLPRNSVV